MSTKGCTLMPGESMRNSRKEMPRCLGASGSVRTKQKIQSARWAVLVQILWPLTTQWSPSSTALVRRLARSLPALGSE